jgi:hypothetical protein
LSSTIKTYKLCKYTTKTTTLILYITIDKTTKIEENKNLAKKEKTHHPLFLKKQQQKYKGKNTLRGTTKRTKKKRKNTKTPTLFPKKKTSSHTRHNKTTILGPRIIVKNLIPKKNTHLDLPQTHNTYCYQNTTQINPKFKQIIKTRKTLPNKNKKTKHHISPPKSPTNLTPLNNDNTYSYNNKKSLLKCGDIESNPGPRITPLHNHPPIHHEKQKTYFYNKTTQLKPEYEHIFKLFTPYLNHTETTNINPHLIQFYINNRHCPKNYLFYALLITLAPIPIQYKQLIENNHTQWTTTLIKNLIENPKPLPTDPHKLQKFHYENTNIITPPENIQNELYSFITTECPNLTTLQKKIPYLSNKLTEEALKCLQPIPNFTHPQPTQNHPHINPQYTPHTNTAINMLTWNCGTLNTTLLGLQNLTNKENPPSIIAIQETKLTSSKSTKYLHRIFPHYKMIFNNTNTAIQTRRTQGQPYNNPRGGLLILIHQQHTFPGNIIKIPTTADISPYFQKIKLTNHLLTTYFLIHLYMPTHIDDIIHIPIIQTTIFNHIHNNSLSNIILFGDFNRDIALIGKQHGTTKTTPTQQDLNWKHFTNSLHL